MSTSKAASFGQITSDAGLLPLREFDKRWHLTEGMDSCISDPREQILIDHQQLEMVRQRLYQIVAGYEDTDDCDLLRNDPMMNHVPVIVKAGPPATMAG